MKLRPCIFGLIFTYFLAAFSSTYGQSFIYAKGLKNSTISGGPVVNKYIKTDTLGNSYVVGTFSGVADFDSGPDSVNLIAEGMEDIFLAKYDATGNYVYAKRIGGVEDDVPTGLAVDGIGNVYLSGNVQGPVDFDPGPGTAIMTGKVFIANYDSLGSLVYAKVIDGISNLSIQSLALDRSHNTYITGSFSDTVDFDPDSSIAPGAGSGRFVDIFFAKYDSSGRYLYVKVLAGSTVHTGRGSAIGVNEAGNVYITGGFTGTIDFDPGIGTANLTTGSSKDDIFLAAYDSDGTYRYARKFSGLDFDLAHALAADNAGNVYTTGSFVSSIDFDVNNVGGEVAGVGGLDIYIAKHDSSGNYVYARSIGGFGYDEGRGIALDAVGNVYVSGYFSDVADFDPGGSAAILTSAGGTDAFVLKLDPTGNYVFAKAMGGRLSDYGNYISVDGNGHLYAAGSFTDTADFNPDAGSSLLTVPGTGVNGFVVSLINTGNYLWAIQQGHYSNIGLYDQAKSVAVDSSGNIYITGSFSGGVDFDPGPNVAQFTSIAHSDVFVAKYDRSGTYVFAIALEGTGWERGQCIALDPSGNVYITGSFRGTIDLDPGAGIANHTSIAADGIFIAKYDATGNYIHSNSITGQYDIFTYGLAVDNAGSSFMTGSFLGSVDFDPGPNVVNLTGGSRDIFIARYDASGDYVYARAMGGSGTDIGRGIAVDGSGQAHVTGVFEGTADFDPGVAISDLTSAGNGDIFVAGYDASGNFIYARGLGGTRDDVAVGIALSSNGNVHITGDFNGTVDFDAGPGTALLTSAGSSDIFLASYDHSGNYLYANSIAGLNTSSSQAIATDNLNNIYLAGSFFGTADFDPGPNTINHTSAGHLDIFVAKYTSTGNYVFAKAMGGTAPDYGFSVAADRSGNVYVAGSFRHTADFNRGAGSTNGIITSLNADDIFFAKYGPSASLPVQLLSFTVKAVLNGDAVEINWSTASEKNNAYFEVERSKDGIRFEFVGREEGCLMCSGIQHYKLVDKNPYEGVSYYRLQQVDKDNATFYSRIETIKLIKRRTAAIHLYPNITEGEFTLLVQNNQSRAKAVINIHNAAGSLIQSQTVWLVQGNSTFYYSLSSQPRGIYYISLTGYNGVKVFASSLFKK